MRSSGRDLSLAMSKSIRNAGRDAGRDPNAGCDPATPHKECDDLFQGHHAKHPVPGRVPPEPDQKKIAPTAAVIRLTLAELRRQMVPVPAAKLTLGKRLIFRDDPCPPLHSLKALKDSGDTTEVAHPKNLEQILGPKKLVPTRDIIPFMFTRCAARCAKSPCRRWLVPQRRPTHIPKPPMEMLLLISA
jgi:hypothetical protein